MGKTDKKGDKIYKRGKPSDYMAIEVELNIDVVAQRQSGNEPSLDYGKKGVG